MFISSCMACHKTWTLQQRHMQYCYHSRAGQTARHDQYVEWERQNKNNKQAHNQQHSARNIRTQHTTQHMNIRAAENKPEKWGQLRICGSACPCCYIYRKTSKQTSDADGQEKTNVWLNKSWNRFQTRVSSCRRQGPLTASNFPLINIDKNCNNPRKINLRQPKGQLHSQSCC